MQLLDFNALSSATDAPRGLGGTWTDWHYSCKFLWDDPEVRSEGAARGRVGVEGQKLARVRRELVSDSGSGLWRVELRGRVRVEVRFRARVWARARVRVRAGSWLG